MSTSMRTRGFTWWTDVETPLTGVSVRVDRLALMRQVGKDDFMIVFDRRWDGRGYYTLIRKPPVKTRLRRALDKLLQTSTQGLETPMRNRVFIHTKKQYDITLRRAQMAEDVRAT